MKITISTNTEQPGYNLEIETEKGAENYPNISSIEVVAFISKALISQ